jgi:hypothetical protein
VYEVDVLPCEAQSVEYANPNVDSIMMGEAGIRQKNESCKKAEKTEELYKKQFFDQEGTSKRYQ